MDARLLRHYNTELQHLREMGAEFARQFPRIAARLSMDDLEVADPYVERLLEGVSFLAARVQLKLEAEFPRFTQALLEMVYPHYLAPTPSMVVVRLDPQPGVPQLAAGAHVPRGTALFSRAEAGRTACEFRTAQEVTLWPIEITSARYVTFAPDLPPDAGCPPFAGGLRIGLRTLDGAPFSTLALDRLPLYFTGRADLATRLYGRCLGSPAGVAVVPRGGGRRTVSTLPPEAIRAVGYDDEEALLPSAWRGFQGHRLLQEYLSFPERSRFVEVTGLQPALGAVADSEMDILLLFSESDPALERLVDAGQVALFCTPAVNLYPRRLDRIHLGDDRHEYHVVADRTRPLDHEIYEVTSVCGHGAGSAADREFLPFYAARGPDAAAAGAAYFTVRREPRLVGGDEALRGSRSGYAGTELFLSLVDPQEAPFSGALRQLSVKALCTNRDLPLRMPIGSGETDMTLDIAAPVSRIRVVAGPSRPYGPLADGAAAWRAINHLSLNYLSLVDTPGGDAAAMLRDLLQLYVPAGDAGTQRQIAGITAVASRAVVRRLPATTGPLAFGRGLEIAITVDELAFEGASPYTFGAMLSRFFARQVSINTFVQTVLRSDGRGEIGRWEPSWGTRPVL